MIEFKIGMYVRVPVDYEDSINPRMFAIGQIKKIDIDLVTVMFYKNNRSKEDEIIHSYIPSEKIVSISEIRRSKILPKSIVINGFDILEVISFGGICKHGYNLYYVRYNTNKIDLISEKNIIVDFSRGQADVYKQMLNYEFHSPFWYKKRKNASAALNIIDNFGVGFKTLLGSRAYLFEHQIDTIIRALNEENCRLMLADEVGLGKTIEALVIIKGLKKKKERVFMIIPDSLVNQWKYELESKFWLDSSIYNGKNLNESDIIIVPMSLITHISLCDIKNNFDYCVIDEVHRSVKNEELYSCLLNVCKNISKILLLSATPIQSRKDEYLKLLILLNPEKYETMTSQDFINLYNRNSKIKKTVHKISRNLSQVYGKEIDEEGIDDILDYIDDICLDLEDKCLNNMFNELEKLVDNKEYMLTENKIYEILSYISITYQFENNIIRHRREELKSILPKRELDLHYYTMKSSSENYYERNTYSEIIKYIEALKEYNLWDNNLYSYITYLLSATLSSPLAIKSLLLYRQKILTTSNFANINLVYRGIEKITGFNGELEYINNLLITINKWEIATFEELDNINDILDDPELAKGRLAKIIDYIQENLYENKVVLFSSWSETVEVIYNYLKKLYGEERVVTFYSKDNYEKLEQNIWKFQNDNNCKFMICDELGGEGRNFQIADALIHIDIPFSPTSLEQRIGRLDRIGRDKENNVLNILFISEDTLETSLFNLWNEGLNIFNESLSGLEIALEDIYDEVANSLASDIEYGLEDSLNRIKENLIKMKSSIQEERYYDMARQLDYNTKKKYRNLINTFDNEGGRVLADMMLSWAKAVGFSPSSIESNIVEFDRTSVNNASLRHTMFTIPNTSESLKRSKKSNVIRGTFDRSIAINKEDLVFFSPGESIFDSILTNVEEGYRGKSIAINVNDAPFEWEGFVFKYNTKFGINELLKNSYDIRYESYSYDHMPINQFTHIIPIIDYDIELNKVKKFIDEDLDEIIIKKSKVEHLGQRSGLNSNINKFKKIYTKNNWNNILKNVYKTSLKKLNEEYVLSIDIKKVNRTFSKILASKIVGERFFNKTIDSSELKNILKSVQNGLINPQIDLDSIMYIKMEKKDE